MGFSKMLELLQEKNKGYIILANAGAFYLARGKDAVKLNEILGLKLLCMEPEVCKIGIPVNSIETYMKKILYIYKDIFLLISLLNQYEIYVENLDYLNPQDYHRISIPQECATIQMS